MNENNDLFDQAINAAAKELMADPPETLLKGVMYRIEMDEKPKRFAFGRFTAIAAAAAVVVLAVSLGGRFWEMSPKQDAALGMNNAFPAPTQESALDMNSYADMNTLDETGGYAGSAVSNDADRSEKAAAQAAADTDTGAPMSFGEAPALSPIEQALYDYLGDSEILSVTWETEFLAVVELVNGAGEHETLRITLYEESGQYRVKE